jgi:hypothetical protein
MALPKNDKVVVPLNKKLTQRTPFIFQESVAMVFLLSVNVFFLWVLRGASPSIAALIGVKNGGPRFHPP